MKPPYHLCHVFPLVLIFSIIFDRLADNGRAYEQATTMHLSSYAEDGLRTLAFAFRTIEAAEYESWNTIFTQAKATIGPEREELLEQASETIEKDLILLGVVAVEDKLQKGVSQLSPSFVTFYVFSLVLFNSNDTYSDMFKQMSKVFKKKAALGVLACCIYYLI